MLKICLVSHQYYYRDTRVRRYVDTLVKTGARVHVLCLRPSENQPVKAEEGVRVITLPIGRSYGGRLAYVVEYALAFVLYAVYLTALQLRHRYHIIQVHNIPDILIWAALLPRLLGAKLVLDVRDPMPELYMSKFSDDKGGAVQRLLCWQERLSCWLAHRVITANSNFEENLVARGVPRGKITVLTNAPDLDIFDRAKYPPAPDPEHERFTLIYTGTIAPRYGLDVAIRAMPFLIPEIPQVRLRIIGPNTSYTQELVALAQALGVASHVEFKAAIPIEEIPKETRHAHVGVYPAILTPHTDIATPCKVLEYAVMGLPVVAPRLKILRQIFGENALAFFVPGDAQDLAARVLELYRDPGLRARLVRAADAAYVQSGGWEAEKLAYFDLLNRLLPHDERIVSADAKGALSA